MFTCLWSAARVAGLLLSCGRHAAAAAAAVKKPSDGTRLDCSASVVDRKSGDRCTPKIRRLGIIFLIEKVIVHSS